MKFFKRKKQEQSLATGSIAAGWIANGIRKIQRYWANMMGRCFNHLSPLIKKVVLIGCCLLMVGYSSILIASSFRNATIVFAKPIAASLPLSISKPAPPMPVGIPTYIKRIERFKAYLDSLGSTQDGRMIRDSILQRRPGLLDSIRRIEIIYCQK